MLLFTGVAYHYLLLPRNLRQVETNGAPSCSKISHGENPNASQYLCFQVCERKKYWPEGDKGEVEVYLEEKEQEDGEEQAQGLEEYVAKR